MQLHYVIQTPTSSLDKSKTFYQSLRFSELADGDEQLWTDGKVLICINPVRTARTAIRIFGDWESAIDGISQRTYVSSANNVHTFSDPNGVHISLEPPRSIEVPGEPASVLGNYAGVSIETTDFQRTVEFWTLLGLEQSSGDEAQGWVSLSREGGPEISVMKTGACPHLFFSPGLTYFNSGKNLENIAEMRAAGVEIFEEITAFNSEGLADNVILQDPGGTGFFIFND